MISLLDHVEAFAESTGSDLIQLTEKMPKSPAEAVAFATEAPFLKQLGLEALALGPGSIGQAHQPDEYLSLDQIKPSIDLIRQCIRHFCF